MLSITFQAIFRTVYALNFILPTNHLKESCFLVPRDHFYIEPEPICGNGNMPQRRPKKSTVIRLPRGERSDPTSKVIVASRNAPISEAFELMLPSQAMPNFVTATTSSILPIESRIPSLPFDIWRKILWHARVDLRTVFNCTKVSVDVRRAASEVLSSIKSVDLSRLVGHRFMIRTDQSDSNKDSGSCYVPTEKEVERAVQMLPNLQEICVTRWPYVAPFPHIAHVLMSTLVSTTLQSATFSHVPIPLNELLVWLQSCPNLNSLRFASHPTVNDELCYKLAGWRKSCSLPLCRLRLLALSYSREISDKGIAAVLRAGLCSQFVGTCLPSLRTVFLTSMVRPTTSVDVNPPTISVLHLITCRALGSLMFKDAKAAPRELILSQCLSLTKIGLSSTFPQDQPLPIERLIVTGCPRLSNFSIPTASGHPVPFHNLKELNLFGARMLKPRNVQTVLGLDCVDGPSLPNLQMLNINGTSIESVVLQGYSSLVKVDISGSCVRDLTISQCWALRKLAMLGKKMPLANVSISVSSDCEVIGIRHEWHWERCGDGPSSIIRFEHSTG